jgi:hypothetical protein
LFGYLRWGVSCRDANGTQADVKSSYFGDLARNFFGGGGVHAIGNFGVI